MEIYLLERVESDDFSYEEMYSCVVIAASEIAARNYAAAHAGDEGPDKWLSTRVTVRRLGRSRSHNLELVCRDFHAG